MSKASHETKNTRNEGKHYGYQRAVEQRAAESMTAPTVGALKDKLLANVSELIEALAASADGRSSAAGAAPNAGAAPSSTSTGYGSGNPAPVGGAPAVGAPAAGTGSHGGPSTSQPASNASSAANASTSTNGHTKPATHHGGTGTSGPGYGEPSAPDHESAEKSLAAQRELYSMDRAREMARRRKRATEGAAQSRPALNLSKGSPVVESKHQTDSNRAPLTDERAFEHSFGAERKSTAVTREKIARQLRRPESVPGPGMVSTGRPLDAYWASYGSAVERAAARARVPTQLEVILGTDDRERITTTDVYPWRCICSLLITAQNNTQWIGTGWLVSPRLVLTAGHCVYMVEEGGWASKIEVIPGRNAALRPFGQTVSSDLRSVTGWTRDNDSDFDYGAILLPENSRFGEQLGWFGFASRANSYLEGLTLNISGYPGDGGKAPNADEGSQWWHSRELKDCTERQLSYEIDTVGGQSGAPVWETASDGGRYGVGIHTHGGSVSNGATRITQDVFDNIVLWAGQAP